MNVALRAGLALVAMAVTASTARADITLTFEGLQQGESVNNYYNGGFGGSGSGPGPNYGITFTSDSLALTSGNFSNNPSGDTILFFLNGAGDTMNVAAGFTTGFSFYYAAAYEGSVSVYSGMNGTGSLLATLDLAPTPNPYSVWVPFGVAFAGTAESAIFSGSANFIGFDNITLGSSIPTPEPASIILIGVGGVSLLTYGRRRLKAKAA